MGPKINYHSFFLVLGCILYIGAFAFSEDIYRCWDKGVSIAPKVGVIPENSLGGSKKLQLRANISRGSSHYFAWLALFGVIFFLHRWHLLRNKKQLDHHKRQSKQLIDELKILNYTIGHDLKAPIENTHLILQTLTVRLGTQQDDEIKHLFEQLNRLNQDAKMLIEGLLKLAEYDHLPVVKGIFETTRISQCLAKSLKELHPQRQIEFTIEEMPNLVGDSLLLRKVMLNLLRNSVKFTASRPVAQIEVFSKTTIDHFQIYVKDNGVGFPDKTAHLIFEPFKSAHDRTLYPGSGIGLNICKHIIERHGGKIWGENNPEGGSTFGFSIPKA